MVLVSGRDVVVRDVTLRNISLPKTVGGMGVWLESNDASHPIDGVRLAGICNLGPVRVQGEVRQVEGFDCVAEGRSLI